MGQITATYAKMTAFNPPGNRAVRHFLSLQDYSKEEIYEILALAREIKATCKAGVHTPHLAHQTLAMIFEKSSTRTRVSFETGIYQLGGQGIFLSSRDIHLGRGEPVKDTARVISSMCDMVMIRTYAHSMLEEFARYSRVPVINGLSDGFHPIQLLADFMTMQEHDHAENPVVAYVGDGNNMSHSWLMLAAKLGFELRIATPKGYEPDAAVTQRAREFAAQSGAVIHLGHDPVAAIEGATVVTTDTWASMGQEDEKAQRVRDFQGYIVDETMMARAQSGAIFLHCLPAYRGQEVSESVLEGAQSVVFDEAENRLHAQKGLMVWLDRQR